MINRREFLKFVIASYVVCIAGCNEIKSRKIDVSSLNISVPSWLFDKNSNNYNYSKVISIEEISDNKEFSIIFTENKKLTLDADTSVELLNHKNSDRPTRNSILLKRVLSYSLDAIFRNIPDKKRHKIGSSLKVDFDALQSQDIIEEITIGSMFNLLLQIDNLSEISSVKWSKNTMSFDVY